MFASEHRDGVLQLRRERTRWLSTGYDGGVTTADAAYNVTVPEGWPHQSLDEYVAGRLAAAGFSASAAAESSPSTDGSGSSDGSESGSWDPAGPDGPVLLTGVAQRHARGARLGSVEAVATVGVSNPAPLPADPAGGSLPDRVRSPDTESEPNGESAEPESSRGDAPPGTVNVFVGTTRALSSGALATLLTMAAEARSVTLQRLIGVPGTTSDATVVGTDPDGERARFAGSATRVGAAARVCVREAITASLASRYADDEPPDSVADARHGIRVEARAETFVPGE